MYRTKLPYLEKQSFEYPENKIENSQQKRSSDLQIKILFCFTQKRFY